MKDEKSLLGSGGHPLTHEELLLSMRHESKERSKAVVSGKYGNSGDGTVLYSTNHTTQSTPHENTYT